MLLTKLTLISSTASSCARIRFLQQACKFTSFVGPRSCAVNHNDTFRSLPELKEVTDPRVITRQYSKETGISAVTSQFYTKPVVTLRETDNSVTQQIAHFQNKKLEDLLTFLETLDSRMFDHRSIEVTLKMLVHLVEESSSVGSKNLFSSVGMQKFCRTLKIHSRLLDANGLLLALRLFSVLKAPGNHATFQIIQRLLSKEVNRMGLPQIVYLNRLLKKLDDESGSGSALSEALKQTLPIVFESHVLLWLEHHKYTVVELRDFLSFAVQNRCSDSVVAKLVQSMLEKRNNLNAEDAFRILCDLCDRRRDAEGMEELVRVLMDVLLRCGDEVDVNHLRVLLIKFSGECIHGRRSFYNEAFVDAGVLRQLQTGDAVVVMNCLKTLWAMKHLNVEVLETVAELLISNPALILNADSLFYWTLKAYSDLNYRPEKWDTLKDIFLNHPATTKNVKKRDVSTLLHFLILDTPPMNMFESVPSVEHLYDSNSDFLELALIFGAIKQLYPSSNSNVPVPSPSTLQIWSEKMKEKSKKFTYPVKETLHQGLGGDSYAVTGLVHEGIHIDHCIVLRHGGYPVFQSNPSPNGLDEIERPENSFLILIKVLRPNAFLWNTERLRGSYDLEMKILESYGHCITINSSEWHKLPEPRKLPFLMEKIRQHTGPPSS